MRTPTWRNRALHTAQFQRFKSSSNIHLKFIIGQEEAYQASPAGAYQTKDGALSATGWPVTSGVYRLGLGLPGGCLFKGFLVHAHFLNSIQGRMLRSPLWLRLQLQLNEHMASSLPVAHTQTHQGFYFVDWRRATTDPHQEH